MKHANFTLAAFFLFLGALLIPINAFAQQFVSDTGFCKDVKERDCVDAIAAGESIDLSELQHDANGPVLYFWGSLKNPEQSLVAHYVSRQGDCYSEAKTVGGNRAGAS